MKKYWFLGVVFLMLVGAVILNTRTNKGTVDDNSQDLLQQDAADAGNAQTQQNGVVLNYYDSFKSDRDAVRSEEIAYLDEVIAVSATDAETLADAQQQKLALIDNMEKELIIESLITAKGFANAAVLFHSGSVNVVVDAETLSAEQVAQILDIVQRETGESAANIRVLPNQS